MFNCYYKPPGEYNLGYISLRADRSGLTKLIFEDEITIPEHINPILEQCKLELNEYFAGERKEFSIPLSLNGTDFRKKVWQYLQKIPYGEVCTYKQLACEVANKSYSRAVGHANSKNPISIIVPCHRVIGANNKLTGYAWGLERKNILLNLEKKFNK